MKRKLIYFAVLAISAAYAPCFAEGEADIEAPLSGEYADVESFAAEDSIFQRIANLEQEKILMQLEKEKAQLQLDLDRLAAEQMRIAREQENADMRAEEQAAEIERQKLEIEQERQKLDEQKKKMADEAALRATERSASASSSRQDAASAAKGRASSSASDPDSGPIGEKYVVLEIVGSGSQLVATVSNVRTGKQKKLSVGRQLDGYDVRTISVDEGVGLEKDGEFVMLGVGS